MNDSETTGKAAEIRAQFERHVAPTYGRFPLVLERGEGRQVWDVDGKRFLDLGAGIAVCSLGHAHPELAQVLHEQAQKLVHVSNLYHFESQARLAQQIAGLIGPGKAFFCNSGAEANETLYKLARKFGHEEGRFEIVTARNSFHGRTLAGIAATGQDKVKKGFAPATPGFRHAAFNDLEALKAAISPATIAILIEGIQGEGGVLEATPDYLLGLRRLCNEMNLLLLMDGVQCGHFRTGRFQSYQRILENAGDTAGFLPDGISMAKSLGGGFPMGAVWIRDTYADVLGPGSHGTTFGGTPLACEVALKILEIVERDGLADNARELGELLKSELEHLRKRFPALITDVRGLGLMIGIEFAETIPALGASDRPPSLQIVTRLHEAGLLTIPAGARVVRLLPPLNLTREEAREGISLIASVAEKLSS